MNRPPTSALVALGIGIPLGVQAARHRHLIAALYWGRRLKPPEEPDPTAADPVATTAYLATTRAHRSHP